MDGVCPRGSNCRATLCECYKSGSLVGDVPCDCHRCYSWVPQNDVTQGIQGTQVVGKNTDDHCLSVSTGRPNGMGGSA